MRRSPGRRPLIAPLCRALVAREARKGPHAGRLFLACSRFPECRYAAPQESVKH
jgi:ssDNA-binding Zn-finger/Zn-ribbon topoisomerase 1